MTSFQFGVSPDRRPSSVTDACCSPPLWAQRPPPSDLEYTWIRQARDDSWFRPCGVLHRIQHRGWLAFPGRWDCVPASSGVPQSPKGHKDVPSFLVVAFHHQIASVAVCAVLHHWESHSKRGVIAALCHSVSSLPSARVRPASLLKQTSYRLARCPPACSEHSSVVSLPSLRSHPDAVECFLPRWALPFLQHAALGKTPHGLVRTGGHNRCCSVVERSVA